MLLIEHRKARQLYEIIETLEAGLVLTGPEAKSLRYKHGSLTGSHVTLVGGKPVLLNAQISPYKYADNREYEPTRTRPLLLKQKEIDQLSQWLDTKGHTAIPLSIELEGRWIKLKIGLARGKKSFERKQEVKERDQKREFQRFLKEG
jgi:SsrA-binding protein